MLPAKAIKCGILGIVGQEGASIEYGIAWCSSYFDEMYEWLMRGNEIIRPWVSSQASECLDELRVSRKG